MQCRRSTGRAPGSPARPQQVRAARYGHVQQVDDQFAHALPADKIVEAVYAAPYYNDRSSGPADGMEKSYDGFYDEGIARRLGLQRLHRLFGQRPPQESEAARDLVQRVDSPPTTRSTWSPRAITNVASAISWSRTSSSASLSFKAAMPGRTREFNWRRRSARSLRQRRRCASCMGVTTHLHTVPVEAHVIPWPSAIIWWTSKGYHEDHRLVEVIWDIATIPNRLRLTPTDLVHSPS